MTFQVVGRGDIFGCPTTLERCWPKIRTIYDTLGLEVWPKLRTVLSLNFIEVFLKGEAGVYSLNKE